MENTLMRRINEAKAYLADKIGFEPEIGLILGSGLGELGEEVENKIYVNYGDIPNFPVSTVAGHKGRFVLGTLMGKKVAVMQGRFHFYEGYKMQEVVFPVWVMKALGINKLIVTNAAGGINTVYTPGDLMIIKDHINYTNLNPLIGPNNEEFGPRFPDMSSAYSKDMIHIIKESAASLDLKLREGVYILLTGPSYETPAEIKALRILGADAVGMSTVPEVVTANHCGMAVAGISCITNMAAGILDQPLNHSEVMETAEKVKVSFSKLIKTVVGKL